MNEIVYLNHAIAEPTSVGEKGFWDMKDLVVIKPPTKCKVTINKTIVIDEVYVYPCKDGTYSLFKGYGIHKRGICSGMYCNYWAEFLGDHLVIQFKSDDFVIEKSKE
jgi:hypothetical protein